MLKSLTTFWAEAGSASVASAIGELIFVDYTGDGSELFDHLRHRPADIGRTVDHSHAGVGEGSHLLGRGPLSACDDGTRVTHPAAGGRGLARDESDDGLRE